MSVKVTGEQELLAALRKLGSSYTRDQKVADLLVAVQPMVQAARGNVATGPPSLHLKDNIGAAEVPVSEAAVAVGAHRVPQIGVIFYGSFLEFGTYKQGATPWLRPAFDSTKEQVTKRVASLVRGRLVAA